MGFLEAVYAIGKMHMSNESPPEWEDVEKFLMPPLPITDDSNKNGYVIRVWLDVEDPFADQLIVRDVADIDVVEYLSGEGTIQEQIRKYLYKGPSGNASKKPYSPLLNIKNPSSDRIKKLNKLKTVEDWANNEHSPFQALYTKILSPLQEKGVLSQGSAELIRDKLAGMHKKFCGLWTDERRYYIVILGCKDGKKFLYPGEIPVFISHFKRQIQEQIKTDNSVKCSICGKSGEYNIEFGKVFKFATSDKLGFFPACQKENVPKGFPVCQNCYAVFVKGNEIVENKFSYRYILDNMARGIIPKEILMNYKNIGKKNGQEKIHLYVVPELIFNEKDYLPAKVIKPIHDFLKTGIKQEVNLFKNLAQQGDSLALHFVFLGQVEGKDQKRIHLMIEDVPPSRLKKLEEIWKQSVHACFLPTKNKKEPDKEDLCLDAAIRNIVATYVELVSVNNGEKHFQIDNCLKILGNLLSGDQICVSSLKVNLTSRFTGLFSSDNWNKIGTATTQRMMLVADFLERVNQARRCM
ncbi:TM1802 family CRISPR-associated protein [Thermovirga lienii]|uniref:TM1802 family CRISPR-associated protein n=1 Tax=Thermovirga lienii TaxID=336261 RepID=UPI002FE2AF78